MSYQADRMLDAVEAWARHAGAPWWMLRETAAGADRGGRLDAVLVPLSIKCDIFSLRHYPKSSGQRLHWTDRLGLVGVEVKASRADFLRGLEAGQLERYAGELSGLYLATGPDVKTSEVPDGIGHLVLFDPLPARGPDRGARVARGPGHRCVCKRRPRYQVRPLSNEQAWRLVFAVFGLHQERHFERHKRMAAIEATVGKRAERIISAMIRATEESNP